MLPVGKRVDCMQAQYEHSRLAPFMDRLAPFMDRCKTNKWHLLFAPAYSAQNHERVSRVKLDPLNAEWLKMGYFCKHGADWSHLAGAGGVPAKRILSICVMFYIMLCIDSSPCPVLYRGSWVQLHLYIWCIEQMVYTAIICYCIYNYIITGCQIPMACIHKRSMFVHLYEYMPFCPCT